MMYRIVWEIDLDAGSSREAAELARAVQRDVGAQVGFFTVTAEDGETTYVDLTPDEV